MHQKVAKSSVHNGVTRRMSLRRPALAGQPDCLVLRVRVVRAALYRAIARRGRNEHATPTALQTITNSDVVVLTGATTQLARLYFAGMNLDVWIGAGTTLLGAALGGAISFVLSRQQIKASQIQQEADRANQSYQRNVERRFQVYSDYLIRSRSFRNALQAYYLRSDHKPSIEAIDEILHSAQDAAALVFLVVESEDAYKACVDVLRALGEAQAAVHDLKPSKDNPWRKLNVNLGRSTRNFQVAARRELGVTGPTRPWGSKANVEQEEAEPDGLNA